MNEVKRPDYSFIVPTYNEKDYIEACLRSLRMQTAGDLTFEVVVSDAGSNDGTRDIARAYADTIKVSERMGIAHGRNQGAGAAQGSILIFVDADVQLEPDFLSHLHGAFRRNQIVGATGKGIPVDGNWFARIVYSITFLLVRMFNAFGQSLFPGMCAAYRAEAFHKLGGFREDFGITEDLDLSKRMSKLGKCVVVPRARALVSTRRLQRHALSTVLFHIYQDLRYLFTGRTASRYPKIEEIKSPTDLWRMNRIKKKRRKLDPTL